MVSTREGFEKTIQKLIQATNEEIMQHSHVSSYTEPVPLNWASAQRGDTGIKIDASVDIGKLKYWSRLLSDTDFSGKKLRQCLDVIHRDIVSVWNIRNSSYLAGDEFKAKMVILVDDLVVNPNTSTDGLTMATVAALATAVSNPAGFVVLAVGSALVIAKWLFDVYVNSFHNVACIMAYIVDLTILMHRLSADEISEKHVISTLQDYATSGEIAQVHNDIRSFASGIRSLPLGNRDCTLDEVIRLIEQHHAQVPQTQMNTPDL